MKTYTKANESIDFDSTGSFKSFGKFNFQLNDCFKCRVFKSIYSFLTTTLYLKDYFYFPILIKIYAS